MGDDPGLSRWAINVVTNVLIRRFGNSLAVQWLELCTFTAEGLVQSLVMELRSHKPCSVAKK